MTYPVPQSVYEAAKMLDNHFNGSQWVEKITKPIDQGSTVTCVFGQVFGDYSYAKRTLFSEFDRDSMIDSGGDCLFDRKFNEGWENVVSNRRKVLNLNKSLKPESTARQILIENVARVKKNLINTLEYDHRNYAELRAILESYIDFQSAADKLGETK